jgi:hypothetical protein
MLSSEKELLSFEQFQSHVLEVFNASKEECEFWSSSSYYSSVISYTNCPWLSFTVKYATDPENCTWGLYGRWIVAKEYDYHFKDISGSLIQGIKVLEQQTEKSIREETVIFEKIEK